MEQKFLHDAIKEFVLLGVNDRIDYIQNLVASNYSWEYIWQLRRAVIKLENKGY